jgi:hypothetical protein
MRVSGLDPTTVSEYADCMRAGVTLPPIITYFDGVAYWPGDGFHRIEAAIAIGSDSILAEVRQGTSRDAVLHAAGANASHGLRRTAADKRRAIESLLRDPEWGKWSDREIGKACGADGKTVAKVRRELTAEIRTERTYRDRHGNVSEMKIAPREVTAEIRTVTIKEKFITSLSNTELLEECERRGLKVTP